MDVTGAAPVAATTQAPADQAATDAAAAATAAMYAAYMPQAAMLQPMAMAIPSVQPTMVMQPTVTTAPQSGEESGLPGCVLCVTNLVNAASLHTLYALYGDVIRCKVPPERPDMALVQYAQPQIAAQAAGYLQRCPLYGQEMNVTVTQYGVIPVAAGEEEYVSCREAVPRSNVDPRNLVAPGSSLHLANLHPDVTEDSLTSLFATYGQVLGFEYFRTTNKMGTLRMDSTNSAVTALVSLNGYTMSLATGKKCTIFVSFSKSGQQRGSDVRAQVYAPTAAFDPAAAAAQAAAAYMQMMMAYGQAAYPVGYSVAPTVQPGYVAAIPGYSFAQPAAPVPLTSTDTPAAVVVEAAPASPPSVSAPSSSPPASAPLQTGDGST